MTLQRLALALCLGAVLAAGWAAWRQGFTVDEPDHLAWSRRLIEERRTDREAWPFNSKTPVTALNVLAQKRVRRLVGPGHPETTRLAARLPTVALCGILLAATWGWGRALSGPRAGALAAAALALDPNIVAHGSLATVDLAFALATLLTLWAGWRFAERPGARRGALLGLALGAAFVTKYTAVLLVPALLALPLCRPPGSKPRAAPLALGLALAVIAAIVAIDAAYLGVSVGTPLRDVAWASDPFQRLAGALPDLRPPVPRDFLKGLDMVIENDRHKDWNVVLLGRASPHGVWYYFPVLWVLKTPLLLLGALAFGLVRAAGQRAQPAIRYLGISLALFLAYFCLVFNVQIGYRYVLMVLPLVALLAAAGLAPVLETRGGARALGLVLAGSLIEIAPRLAAGDPLAFTSVLVQPRDEVYRWMTGSNVDWGQDDDRVIRALEEGGVVTRRNPPHVLPGHNSFSIAVLGGGQQFERHRWVRENLHPAGTFGPTWVWFDVTASQFDRFLAEARTLALRPRDASLCEAAPDQGALADPTPFRVTREPGHAWLLCVDAPAPADVTLEVTAGSAWITRPGRVYKHGEAIRAGQSLVYRLVPGRHAFVVGRGTPEGRLRASVPGMTWRLGPVAVERHGLPEAWCLAPGADCEAPVDDGDGP